jgi:chromosome segregation and condensation protein ScpB
MTLLEHAWSKGFTIMSDYAQRHMELVAMAASLQLITTRVNKDVFSREWQITAKGLRWLNEAKELD